MAPQHLYCNYVQIFNHMKDSRSGARESVKDSPGVQWGSVEDEWGKAGRGVISISGFCRSGKEGPDSVSTVSPLSMPGLSEMFLRSRPASDASTISGWAISGSGLFAPPHLSGMEDSDRPAREWDRNTMLRGGNGTTLSFGSSFPLVGQRWRSSPAEKPDNRGREESRDLSDPFPR